MPILEGDIQIMLSQVLNDVPEGGGAATGTPMTDGVSNNLFSDISELDRVYGDVSLRKVFPKVVTETVDTYYGVHVIVADPPDDPDVSAVIFTTGDGFDTRAQAASRIEAYLNQGANYRGLLYGNHITGQAVISIIQRENVPLPPIGMTLVLRKNEGLLSQVEQYVRITDITSGIYTFEDASGEFTRRVLNLGISDQLRSDFPGFSAVRLDATIEYTNKTKVYETIVADAARYYSVVPLTDEASMGDFSVQAEGIFTQIVPSARAEVPIADARMNQRSQALVAAADGNVTFTIGMTFYQTHPLYVGGGILPGTFSVANGGTVLTDLGGVLQNSAGSNVGAIDYENGVASLSTAVFSPGSALTVVYQPAGTPTVVTETFGVPVTQTSQRLSYALTLDPVPAKGSLQISYMTQGRWYVMQEDGSGAIRGADTSVGAGTINFITGTVSVTLGAMPDVDSHVIFAWAPEVTSVALTPSTDGPRFGFMYPLARAVAPGSLEITWNDGIARTASDSDGNLTGDAAGWVQYNNGTVNLSPNALPARGTNITFAILSTTQAENNLTALTDSGSTWTGTLPAPVRARSFQGSIVAQFPVREYPGTDVTRKTLLMLFDNGAGLLQVANLTGNLTVGTINYSTGAVAITKSVSGFLSTQGRWQDRTFFTGGERIVFTGSENRSLTVQFLNGPGGDTLSVPTWGWWTGAQTQGLRARYAGADGASYTVTVPMNEIKISAIGMFPDAVQTPIGVNSVGMR